MLSNTDKLGKGIRCEIQQSYATFISSLDDGFELLELVRDKDGNIFDFVFLFVNPAYERQTGLKANNIVGKRKKEAAPAAEKRWYDCAIQATKTGKTLSYQYYNPKVNGYYDTQFIPIPPNQIAVLFKDITERKKAEVENRTIFEFLKVANVTTNTLELVKWTLDFFQKQSGCEAVGVRLKEGDDYPYYETRGFPPEHVQLENKLCARDDAGCLIRDYKGQPVIECMCGNVICGRFDPSKKFFTEKGSFWTNSTTQLLTSTTDDDRQVRTRNRCNGEGYESVALVPLQVGNTRYGLLQLNDKRKDMFTLEMIQMWERIADRLALALSRNIAEEALNQAQTKLQEYATSLEMRIEERTKQIAAERKRFFDVLETMPMMVCLISPDYHIVFSNRAFREKFGESKGRHCYDYCFNKSEPCEFCESLKPLETGKPHHWQAKALDESVIDAYDFPFTDTDGSKLVLEIDMDITEQKRLQKQLAEKERLAAIGTTAGMVGHDIRNPLQSIVGELYIAEEEAKVMPESEAKKAMVETLNNIQANILYINKIVQDLQDYARPILPEYSTVNVSKILVRIFETINVPDTIKLSTRINDLETLKTDSTLVQRALSNLVTNAIQAMPDGGTLEIIGHREGNIALITVSDTGIGIADEIKPKLFTPMMTTKSKGQGFGLAVSKRLIEAMKGTISFESEKGKGTKFIIELPFIY